jgi:hypothetical protein
MCGRYYSLFDKQQVAEHFLWGTIGYSVHPIYFQEVKRIQRTQLSAASIYSQLGVLTLHYGVRGG